MDMNQVVGLVMQLLSGGQGGAMDAVKAALKPLLTPHLAPDEQAKLERVESGQADAGEAQGFAAVLAKLFGDKPELGRQAASLLGPVRQLLQPGAGGQDAGSLLGGLGDALGGLFKE